MNDNTTEITNDPKVADIRRRFAEAMKTSQEEVPTKPSDIDETPPVRNYVIESRHQDGPVQLFYKVGYLYVSSSFIAICEGKGVIICLIPAGDLVSVEELEEDEVA